MDQLKTKAILTKTGVVIFISGGVRDPMGQRVPQCENRV